MIKTEQAPATCQYNSAGAGVSGMVLRMGQWRSYLSRHFQYQEACYDEDYEDSQQNHVYD